MKKPIFTGSGVALVTPMNADGSINYTKLGELVDFHLANQTDAIVACATTGESPVLTHEEHCKAIEFVINRVNHKIPVIASTGSNDTAYAVELCKEAQQAGADGFLMVTPYYNKTSQRGLVKHYHYVADRVDLPIILYNVPSRTGLNIKPETYMELAKHPNINATKEANGNISAIAKTVALCGDELNLYSGDDDQTYSMMALGGKGVISVLANVVPAAVHKMCTDYFAGNIKDSLEASLYYIELIETLFMDVNPIPVKEAMNQMGMDVGAPRLPLCEMDEAGKAKVTSVLKKYHLL